MSTGVRLWRQAFAGRLQRGGASLRKLWGGLLAVAGLAGFAGRAGAAELKVGDLAPPFSLQGSDGKTHELAKLSGKAVVLAWFPKAFTGG